MVKTRHNPGGDDERVPVFYSLHSRGSRRNHVDHQDEYESDSDELMIPRKKSHFADRSLDDKIGLRLRPRVRQRRNYFDEYFSDYEIEDEKSPVSRKKNSSKKMDGCGPVGRRQGKKKSAPMRKPRQVDKHASEDELEAEYSGEEGTYLRNTRQRSQASSIQESSLNSKTTKTFDQTMAGSKRKLVEPPPDMYTIVKRKRHSSYSASVLYQECESSNSSRNSNDQENGDTDEDDKDEEDEDNVDEMEDEEDEDEDDETNNNNRSCKKSGKSPIRSSYYLRQNKPRTQHWAPPIEPTRRRPARNSFRIGSNDEYLSPSRKKDSRKKAAFCRTNSSGSEDDTDSDQYNLQKDSSLSWSRFQPLNLTAKDLENQHNRKDRVRAGASHADLDPMRIDLSISFEDVGGQEKTVLELKEKLFLPILYPEFNTRLKLNVPRGVLFHGPPGTGKTLMARALAAECSRGRQQFAFFMRKGADIMSKWVGESERSLRMLFDKAYQMRPSIVFFDEIDGLAPVRSSRQDQIHSSIVSTLLALMDGLDSRGEVIVIGATNRIDALDPALRRPGRFDQEFYFGLPDQEARQKILAIHTKEWKPKLKESFLRELAKETAGYCGADLKMLCTEAWLTAMRNRYPQILESQDKLQIDVNNIVVTARDFADAREKVVPSSQRTVSPPSYPLCPTMAPLLHRPFQSALKCIQEIFPHAIDGLHKTASLEEDASENEETMPSIFEHPRKKNDQPEARFFAYQEHSYIKPSTYRPRLLLAGATGQGLSSHLAPALLHHLEDFPINVLDLPTIMGDGSRTAEEACIHLLREVNRRLPGILYMPDVDLWWELVQETVRGTVTVLVSRIKPTNPLLLLASSSRPYDELPHSLQSLFCEAEAFTIETPNADERLEFFRDLLVKQPTKVVTTRRRHPKCMERLPKAAPEPRPHLTELERDFLNKREEKVLTELRCYLREILNQLSKDRRFCHFTKPVDSETTPDYYNIIRNPMDMDTMMTKIDQHRYLCLEDFMTDITLIRENALEYNPDCTNLGARIRHSAHALVDTAVAMVNDTVDEEFVKMLRAVKESRERRGETPKVPDFAYTARHPSQPTPSAVTASTPLSAGVRCSRRVRGLEVEAMPTLEVVERCGQLERSLQRQHKEPTLSNHGDKNTSNSSVMSQESESAKQDGTSRRLSPHRRRGDPPPPHKRWMRTSSEPSSLPDREESEEETADCAEPRRLRGDVRTLITNTGPAQKTSLNSRKAAATATTSSSPSADASALLSTSNSFSGTLRGASSSTPKLGNFASQATSQPQGQHDLGTLSHDSGVSSSTDSNGDSMDSVDQTLLQKDSNCHQEQDTNENQGGSEEPAPRLPVVVNLARLDKLLRKVVDRSAGWTIEELGKLHNAFGRSLFHHRRNHDKTELVEELEAKAEHLCFSKKDHGQ